MEISYRTAFGQLLVLNAGDIDVRAATAIVTGKGDKQRLVSTGQTALRLLESYLKAVRPFLVRGSDSKAIVLKHAENRMPYHTFRTTELIRDCANLHHVKEILGHENLETLKTLRQTHHRRSQGNPLTMPSQGTGRRRHIANVFLASAH